MPPVTTRRTDVAHGGVSPVLIRVPRFSTDGAVTPISPDIDSIRKSQVMPVVAGCSRQGSTTHVLGMSDWFEMVRVHTSSDAAQMVKFKSGRDRSFVHDVDVAVRLVAGFGAVGPVIGSVPLGIKECSPKPAATFVYTVHVAPARGGLDGGARVSKPQVVAVAHASFHRGFDIDRPAISQGRVKASRRMAHGDTVSDLHRREVAA